MPAEFHWLRPEWLFAIPLIVVIAVLLARGKLGSGNWQLVIDPALMPFVLSRDPGRGTDYRWWLTGIGGVIALTALAGPAWQRIEQPVFRAEQALVLALDLSRSMDAQDVAPSRLRRAKLKILDMLDRRESGQTALLVYSANAFTVTPVDERQRHYCGAREQPRNRYHAKSGKLPGGCHCQGQATPGSGKRRIWRSTADYRWWFIPWCRARARELKSAGYSLSILGVGTTEGAPIPRASGGFVTDNRGQIAVPRLEERGLRSLAGIGGGRYARISTDDRDLDTLLSGEISGGAAISDDALATDRWREEGPWLLLLLLPLAALAFRRGWVLVALIFIVPMPQAAHAASWTDLWLNKDQQAERELLAGNASDAAALFENPDWQAVADYRAGDYAGSARVFAENDDTRNLYNLANAMALQGELDSAIDTYEQVLEIEADNEDASYNLELVKSLKDQQEQEQQNQGDDQQSTENPGGEGEQSDSENQPDQQGEEGESQSDNESQEGDPSDSEEMSEEDMKALQEELQRAAEEAESGEQPQQMSEAELAELRQQQEQEQALEQWLRRIPDDPGGLLRRKFRHQYQRSGKDQDGNSVWPDNEVQPW